MWHSNHIVRPHLATLVDDFRRHGAEIAVVTYSGNRRVVASYADLAAMAEGFAVELERRRITLGERVILWGQNSAAWVGAFFGCVLQGVIAVPLDAAGSVDFAKRVMSETRPLLVAGDADLLRLLPNDVAKFDFTHVSTERASGAHYPASVTLTADTPLQILFTSGTTAAPKGVVHTHRNVLASLTPIEREMQKYLRYERIFHPLRFLHTLPLSHVFGQFMGLWVPPLLAAEVHFESRLQAPRLIQIIQRNRISVLAAVPRVLDLMKLQLEAEHPELQAKLDAAKGIPAWKRWWRFRKVHRAFGFKFWAFVCGGASLKPELERFWRELGFALIQGYGMTETAALITLNHPFHTGQGTIGTPLPGREIRISDDGEIQVKGEMVSSSVWQGGSIQQREDPWLATGDLVSSDEQGRLRFVGRKSEVIVTASGLNVHPEDVEGALRAQPGVEEVVVVPLAARSGLEPAAVLLFRGDRDAAGRAVLAANAQLAEFQQVRHWRIWKDLDFPRTSTGKIQRRKVSEWLAAEAAAPVGENNGASTADSLEVLLASVSGVAPTEISNSSRLSEDLHLDSLARVQLQSELDRRWGVNIGDDAFARLVTVGDLRLASGFDPNAATTTHHAEMPIDKASTASTAPAPLPATDAVYPRWPWSWPVRGLRTLFVEAVMRPLVWLLAAPRVERAAGFQPASQPVLIIANHVTAYDGALVLYALPAGMRHRVAAAMAADMLNDFRRGRGQGNWFLNLLAPAAYWLITALFNVFPLPRNAGFRRSFAHAGEAMDRGYHVLVFPEGRRSLDGKLHPFRSGIGLLAAESNAKILPVALCGLGELKRSGQGWFRSGKLRVKVGALIDPGTETPERLAVQLEETLRSMLGGTR